MTVGPAAVEFNNIKLEISNVYDEIGDMLSSYAERCSLPTHDQTEGTQKLDVAATREQLLKSD